MRKRLRGPYLGAARFCRKKKHKILRKMFDISGQV